jgi:HEAT repeat protein
VKLIKSATPELQEGAARDLGRLAWLERKEPNRQEDATRILIQLSKDYRAGDSVLLGAIEGLGLVSTSQALERLRELAKEKKPVEGKEGSIEYKRILEAISIIAGTRLLGFQEVQTLLSVDEAAELYLTGKSEWVDKCPLSLRITEDKKGTFNAVVALTTHAAEKVRLAAVSLLKLMDSELAKPVLERLATSDPSKQVREAAKSKQ